MRPFLVASICFVFVSAALQAEDSSNVQQALKQVERAPEDAKTQLGPQTAETTILTTARSLRLQNQHSAAADIYAHFLTDFPKSSRLFEARFWLAKSLFASQKWEDAASAFTEFLKHHSDQRVFSKQAKEDRVHCWKLRQKQDPKAVSSLKDALKDQDEAIRILAALALAENRDAYGRLVLEQGLNNANFSEQCGLALWRLGIRSQPRPGEGGEASQARMLIVRVKTADNSFEMRVPISFVAGLEKNLPIEVREELERNGADISGLAKLSATATKGQVLFEFKGDNKKTRVVISVD
jgi:tetratricopeptide (TPR) repeat protein